MTLSTTSPSSLLMHPSAAALALFQVFTVKVRQAPTSYLLVHLTNSTTLTVYVQWYSNRPSRKFLLFTSSEDPLLFYPTHCRRADVSRIPTVSISRPTAQTLPPLLEQRLRVFRLSCTAYGVRELHDYWCLPPHLPAGGGGFGSEVSTTVTSVVKCSMLTLLQPFHGVSFSPKRSGYISVKSS